MRAVFVDVSPVDPLVITPVVIGMLLVALAASLLLAFRAMRVEPTVALRAE